MWHMYKVLFGYSLHEMHCRFRSPFKLLHIGAHALFWFRCARAAGLGSRQLCLPGLLIVLCLLLLVLCVCWAWHWVRLLI